MEGPCKQVISTHCVLASLVTRTGHCGDAKDKGLAPSREGVVGELTSEPALAGQREACGVEMERRGVEMERQGAQRSSPPRHGGGRRLARMGLQGACVGR